MALLTSLGARSFGDIPLLTRLTELLKDCERRGLERLPAEAELCREWEVDRYRLHRAFETLAREGLVTGVPHRGWRLPSPKVDVAVKRHNSYTSSMLKLHKKPHSEILGIDSVPTHDELLEHFPTQRLWVLDYKRYDGELALSLSRLHLDQDSTPGLNLHLRNDTSLYGILEKEYGISPIRETTWCEAASADSIVAGALSIPIGTPVLKTTHLSSWKGRPFEFSVNYLRADQCRVRIDLAQISEESL